MYIKIVLIMMDVLDISLETRWGNVFILVTVLVPVPVPVRVLVPVRVPVELELPVPVDRQNAPIAGFAIWIMVEAVDFVKVRLNYFFSTLKFFRLTPTLSEQITCSKL